MKNTIALLVTIVSLSAGSIVVQKSRKAVEKFRAAVSAVENVS